MSGFHRTFPVYFCAVALLVAASPGTGRADPDQPTYSLDHLDKPLGPEDLRKAPRKANTNLERHLAEAITKVWKSRWLRRGTTAVYVVDAKTGTPIFAVHEDEPMNPASNVKLFSTAAVLDVLGSEFRYRTRVLGPAASAEGVVEGDVYVLGTADPTFTVRDLDRLVKQLTAAGIKSIDGNVVIGSTTIRDGVARASVKVTAVGQAPGKEPSVSVAPMSDYLKIKVTAKSVNRRRGRLDIKVRRVEPEDGEAFAEVEISGRIRRGRKATVWRTVPGRATFTAHTLRAKLIEAGIAITGGVEIEELEAYVDRAIAADYLPIELAYVESAPMSKLVARVNKPSNNYLADRLLMTAGAAAFGGLPTMDKGLKVMRSWLAEDTPLRPDKLTIDTGSGLSYHTRITAEQIVGVLRAGAALDDLDPDGDDKDIAPIFLKSLAIAGSDGTLRRRFRGSSVQGHMVGKTGTLTSVIALSGFVSDGSDDNGLCFAIVTNGHKHHLRNRVRKEHEHLVEAMHDYLRARKRLLRKDSAAGGSGAGKETSRASLN